MNDTGRRSVRNAKVNNTRPSGLGPWRTGDGLASSFVKMKTSRQSYFIQIIYIIRPIRDKQGRSTGRIVDHVEW